MESIILKNRLEKNSGKNDEQWVDKWSAERYLAAIPAPDPYGSYWPDSVWDLLPDVPDGPLTKKQGRAINNLIDALVPRNLFPPEEERDAIHWEAVNQAEKDCNTPSKNPAEWLASDTRLVDAIVTDCQALGIVGERNLILAIYLIGTSRLLKSPLSGIVQGKSSTGKSYLVETIAKLFPPESVLHATRMSPEALYYYEGGLAHKFVVAGERSRVSDDASADATGALRQLQSEGRITKLVTESKEGKFTASTVEQVGPISYVETTTVKATKIFPEDLNRALLLKTDESENHTRNILALSASKYEQQAKPVDVAVIVDKHRAFQAMLKRREVFIPFASKLLAKIPARNVEARRVGPQILSVIEAVAILHQHQRQADTQGRVVATIDDYQVAANILRQPLRTSLGVRSGPTLLYQKIADAFSGDKIFDTAQVQKLDLKAGERTVRTWLTNLVEHGCVEQVTKAAGRIPAKWRLTDKTPEAAVLPEASVLE